jgi:DNA-binding transcriptional regulator YhcF (GntR family)
MKKIFEMSEMTEAPAVKEKKALTSWGKAYIKIPRNLIISLIKGNKENRQFIFLHLVLMTLCNYGESSIYRNGKEMICKRGEYIGSLRQLAKDTGIPATTVRRLLDKLVAQNWIEVTPISKGIRVYLYGYDSFTRSSSSQEGKKKVKTPEEAYAEHIERLNRGIVF